MSDENTNVPGSENTSATQPDVVPGTSPEQPEAPASVPETPAAPAPEPEPAPATPTASAEPKKDWVGGHTVGADTTRKNGSLR